MDIGRSNCVLCYHFCLAAASVPEFSRILTFTRTHTIHMGSTHDTHPRPTHTPAPYAHTRIYLCSTVPRPVANTHETPFLVQVIYKYFGISRRTPDPICLPLCLHVCGGWPGGGGGRVQILDTHDRIFVWSGVDVCGPEYDEVRRACERKFSAEAASRFPAPRVVFLKVSRRCSICSGVQ